MKSPPAGRQEWWWAALLLAATLLAYQPVWRAGFIWDDDEFLTDNPVIKSSDGLYRIWFTASTPDYFPLTSSMLWGEWRLWGNHAPGYHLVNVILHALSALLLWRVLTRLKIPGAWLAAAIFALHPVNVESVAWITERKNTLAMFFYLGALLEYLKFEDTGARRWYALAVGTFALAMLSKSAAAPLPIILLGLAWWRRGRVGWPDLWRSVPFFLVAVVLGLVTVWFQYHRAIVKEVVRTDDFWSRLAGAGWAVWFYLDKALLPWRLSFVYPRWQIHAREVWSFVPLALAAAGFAWCWRRRRTWGRSLFFGMGYYVVMLLPILGFLDIYFMRYSLVADHWQYFGILGPIALVAACLRKPAPALVLLLVLGALTWRQCKLYADEVSLWQAAISENPGGWLAHSRLGSLYVEKGELEKGIAQFREVLAINPNEVDTHNNLGLALARKNDLAGAMLEYRKALAIKPENAVFLNNLGNALARTGNLPESIAQFHQALAFAPGYAEAHNDLGVALFQQNQFDEAAGQFGQALEIKPDYTDARCNLGNALLQKGDFEGALASFKQAAATDPTSLAAWFGLGIAWQQKGNLDEAIACNRQVIKINPRSAGAYANLGLALFQKREIKEAMDCWQQALAINPGQIKVLQDLAWALATTPADSLRNGARAVALAEQADQMSGGGKPVVLRTLAAAYAEVGRFADAAATARRALALAVAQKDDQLEAKLPIEIAGYEAGTPLRAVAQ
jgi:tetratricopeptide (TPR) repeat protein